MKHNKWRIESLLVQHVCMVHHDITNPLEYKHTRLQIVSQSHQSLNWFHISLPLFFLKCPQINYSHGHSVFLDFYPFIHDFGELISNRNQFEVITNKFTF